MAEEQAAGAATHELTDDELRQIQQRARSEQDEHTIRSISSNPIPQTERTVDCPICICRRGAEKANQITQRHNAILGIWMPPYCKDCFAFNEAEQHKRTQQEESDETLRKSELARKMLRSSGLPEPYVVGKRGAKDLDAGPATDGYQVARQICARLVTANLPVPWIWLTGDNGSFKSTLACCTLLQALQVGHAGRYALWPRTIDELRELNRDDAPESVHRYVTRMIQTPRLVIDEIGFGTPTPFAAEKLFRIFEERYQLDSAADLGERWTIFTSNLTLDEFVVTFVSFEQAKMAKRLDRRIKEMSTEIQVLG